MKPTPRRELEQSLDLTQAATKDVELVALLCEESRLELQLKNNRERQQERLRDLKDQIAKGG